MKIPFYKYQGTGNDFIIIDNRQLRLKLNEEQVLIMCDRRFGIGADGLMLIEEQDGYDFKMVYFNSDGKPGSMCGNGGRCIVHLTHQLKISGQHGKFIASDGEHSFHIQNEKIFLKMNEVNQIEKIGSDFFLNTGSPHYIVWVNDIDSVDVFNEGRKIRYSDRFKAEGTNVNFVMHTDDGIFVRTYERGVENETLSCGTGVTASAIVAHYSGKIKNDSLCKVRVIGGKLEVNYKKMDDEFYTDIYLIGPAENVFSGEIEIAE
jgi:diaminopimelate epimerase